MANRPIISTDLLPEEIEEFKQITFRKFGRKFTDEEAVDQLSRLVCAYELIQNDLNDPIENAQKEGQNEH